MLGVLLQPGQVPGQVGTLIRHVVPPTGLQPPRGPLETGEQRLEVRAQQQPHQDSDVGANRSSSAGISTAVLWSGTSNCANASTWPCGWYRNELIY
jgi:hypothetical protein